jgi:hypothetical protein
MEPVPLVTLVARTNGIEPHTAVTRIWAPGDAARCRRCETCSAVRNVCTALASEYLDDRAARNYPPIPAQATACVA